MFCFYIIIIIVEVKFQVKILYQLTKSRSTLVSLNFRFEAKTKATFITSKQKMYSSTKLYLVIPILSLEMRDRFQGR